MTFVLPCISIINYSCNINGTSTPHEKYTYI